MTSTVVPSAPSTNGHNVIKALGRGIFTGIAIAVPFVIAGAFLHALGVTYAIVSSPTDMGLLGLFIGIGYEVYPFLM